MTTMLKGVIKYFDDNRGYGFVTSADGVDYFVHFSAYCDGHNREDLVIGQRVLFTVAQDKHNPNRTKIGKLELAEADAITRIN
jgi:CspA family cold shock protein